MAEKRENKREKKVKKEEKIKQRINNCWMLVNNRIV
jgi:hypothetical protein